ncbi:MAG: hypothetical protein ACOXZY_02910 [Patescibacteria group bacterium]
MNLINNIGIQWIFELKNKVPIFLDKLKSKERLGFLKYSLSGDLFSEKEKWGLGNTVFYVKILYILDLLKDLDDKEKKEIINFIRSFENKNNIFYDPIIKRKSFIKEKLLALKYLDFNNFWHKQIKIAETRQTISVLKLLDEDFNIPDKFLLKTKKDIIKYLEKLNWKNPWNAGSHLSTLLFFIYNSNLENKEELINEVVQWLETIKKPDGFWYKGNPSIQYKINGAMKIFTGFDAIKRKPVVDKKVIDQVLEAINDNHACDNFNIIYVLYHASLIYPDYKKEEIKKFALDRLENYKKYYYSDIGGFSFQKNKANQVYYGAKITRGLDEPDIHGTVMFLFGIDVISRILEIGEELKFNYLEV